VKREEAEKSFVELQDEITKLRAECRSVSAALAQAHAKDHYIGQQSQQADDDIEYLKDQVHQAQAQRDA